MEKKNEESEGLDPMPQTIILLSDSTVNKIAAGEVIENPASLVKELIENSLDAGASKIVIEVTGGGLDLLSVRDDGSGMGPEDAVLSLRRHATSKICDTSDLTDIATMGFRGEALASAAAVSRLTLETADASGIGTRIVTEGGNILETSPCARRRGTTVSIENLFYNVPARKKFQKSPAACLADITKTVTALSLANPFTGFELYGGTRKILHLLPPPSTSLLEALTIRAREVLGEEFQEGYIPVEGTFGPFTCQGLLGDSRHTRPNRSLQYQFFHGRSVLCPAVSYAVKEAFGTRIEEKRFPVYVLHLTVPKGFIDVNVHPQKKEIRLENEAEFREELRKGICETLFPSSSPLSFVPPAKNLFSEESFRPKPKPFDPPDFEAREEAYIAPLLSPPIRKEAEEPSEQLSFSYEIPPEVIGLYREWLLLDAATVSIEGMPKEGILLVHLPKAEARIVFEELQKPKQSTERQMLFLPLTLSCSPAEMEKIEAEKEGITRLGFLINPCRGGFLIEEIPTFLGEQEALDFLRDYAFAEEKSDRRERRLAASCLAATARRKRSFRKEEALSLFSRLLQTSSPGLCPIGEKTFTLLENDDIRKLLGKN